MPTTSSGDTVYAKPGDVEEYVQGDPETFSLSTSGSPSPWREFLEKIQVRMKARIDEYVDRPDFEDHAADTITLNGGASASRILELPSPVRTITEVRVDGSALTTDQYQWSEEGQLIRVDAEDSALSKQWPEGYGNIEVDLDWGYSTPPADVQDAEMQLVANTVTGLAQMREGMVVQQDDIDLQIALPEAMTTEIKNLLRHHRTGGRTMGVI